MEPPLALKRNETVTWSGECAGDLAQGEGTLTWAVADADSSRVTGTYQQGASVTARSTANGSHPARKYTITARKYTI